MSGKYNQSLSPTITAARWKAQAMPYNKLDAKR